MSQKEYVVKYRKPAIVKTVDASAVIGIDTQEFTNVHDFKEFVSSL